MKAAVGCCFCCCCACFHVRSFVRSFVHSLSCCRLCSCVVVVLLSLSAPSSSSSSSSLLSALRKKAPSQRRSLYCLASFRRRRRHRRHRRCVRCCWLSSRIGTLSPFSTMVSSFANPPPSVCGLPTVSSNRNSKTVPMVGDRVVRLRVVVVVVASARARCCCSGPVFQFVSRHGAGR